MNYREKKTAEMIRYLLRTSDKRTIEIKPYLRRLSRKLEDTGIMSPKELGNVLKFLAIDTGKSVKTLEKQYRILTMPKDVSDNEENALIRLFEE